MAVVVAPAPAQAAPPSNDDFANAEVLPGVGVYTGTNVDATTETGEPHRVVTDVPPPFNDYAPTASVWYQWTAPDVPVPPAMQVSTRGSLATDRSVLDTVLAVYTGTDLTGLVQVAANDDFGEAQGPSRVQFAPVRNTTYWIAVDSCCSGSPVAEGSIRLRLSETTGDGSITGFVTDGALNPIEGICVVALDDTGEQVSSQVVQTDVTGEYLLASVEAGPDRHLKFSNCGGDSSNWAGQFNGGAQTLATASDIVVTNGVPTPVNETLVPGGSIEGTVSADDSGYAGSLANICVRATMVGDPDDGFRRQTVTAADGTYTINGLDGGDYQVTFAENCGSNSNFASEAYPTLVTVTEGSTTDTIDAGLGAAPGAISGTVVAWTVGPALQGICVRANSSSYTSATVQTNSGGNYTITNVPAGTGYVVRFTDCNTPTNPLTTQWFNQALKQSRATGVTVNVGQTTPDIDASMFHAATIGGHLTDGNGNPRYPACVNVYKDDDVVTPIDSVTADTDGIWSTQVPPGNYKLEMTDCGGGGLSFETRWYHNQTSGATADVVFVDQGDVRTNLDQVLPGTPGTDGRIEGVVTDDTVAQDPLQGICVSATAGPGPPATTTTDAQGRYSFDLPADSYVVEFTQCDLTKPYNVFTQYWDDVPAEGDATPVVVTDGTTTSGIGARMHPAGGVSGTVTHGSTPLQDICVSVDLPDGTEVASVFTDASGAYEVKGLPTGDYDVSFEDCNYIYVSEWYNDQPFPDGTPDPVGVTEGTTTSGIDADLDRYGTISGHVTDAAGNPLEDMCVIAYSPPGIFAFSATTDANGDYMVGALGDPDSPTPVQYAVNIFDCANVYGDAWWDNKLDYDTADLVDVTFGQDTPNIDAVLQDTDPANTAAPVARGRAVVGVGLRASNGSWDHDPRAFTFQWYRCQADGSDCQPLSDGDRREYVATVDDVGFRLRVDVTAQNNKGSTTAESALTDVVATASAPPNDDIEDREALSGALPIAVLGDNIDATRQPGEPDHLGLADGASVWYEWTAPGGVPGRVTVSLDGSSFDTTLSVYDGTPTPFSGLGLVAENDDYQSMTSTATFAPTPGTTYYIAVDGYVDPTTHEVSEGTLDLRIGAATGIAGTVTAADGGAPVRDICVTATDTPDPAPFGPSIETSADGSYFLELDPGTWYVDFYDCTGQYDEQWYDGVTDPGDATPVTVTGGSVATGIDAALTEAVPYGSISGTVTNENGSPIPDICVVASTLDSSSGGIGYTDQDGTYEVRGLGDPDNPGTALDYVVGFIDCSGFYGEEYYDNKLDPFLGDPVPVTLDQDVTGIDATLQYLDPVNTAPPTITGQASVGQTLTADNGTWDHEPSLFSYEWYTCDADGTNCVVSNSGIDPTYVVTPSDEGHKIRVDVTAENSIGFATASSDLTDVVNTAPPANDDIEDRQVLSGAMPIRVTGANVNATRQPGEPDHLGFTQGASVWYEWTAPSGGAALDTVQMTLAGSTYNTTLSVYDGTPVPFSGLNLVAENDDFASAAQSEVDFAPDPGTTYYIAVDGYFDGTTVSEGTVHLEVSPPTGISGTVTNAASDPVPDICVDAFDTSGSIVGTDSTDANGDYAILGLAPGDYKVDFFDCDLVYIEEWYDDQPDFASANLVHVDDATVTTGIDAELARYGTISGRWTDENGNPVYDPSCGAYAYDATTGDFAGSGFTDVDGSYTIGGLQTGTYVVDFSPCTGGFGEEWWDNKLTQATATPIGVTFGQDTGGINVVLQDTAPVNTTLPSISGPPTAGTLTALDGTWSHQPSAFSYQWLRCNTAGTSCTTIVGAQARTYDAGAADAGSRLRVDVTATNSIGATTARSTATAVIAGPVNSTLPVVSGSVSVGSVLSTSTGTWSGSPAFTYQWVRCDASAPTSCTNIATATGSTYTTTSADSGFRVRARVTASNATGATSALTSNAPLIGVPTLVTAPVISGPVSVGSTLSTTNGTWTGSPTFTYQWLRCNASATNCSDIATATGSTYTTTSSDDGFRIRARVTATNAAGSAASLSDNAPLIGVPVLVMAPVISGPVNVGSTLSTTNGTWTGSPTFTYQWLRCNASATNCSDIATATGSAYTTTSSDDGFRIRVRVTATNAAGSAAALSDNAPLIGVPTLVTAPVISGPVSIGSTLSSTNGTWTGSPTFTYQWLRCDASVPTSCTNIAAATGSNYTTTSDDNGFRIRVRVTATNAAGSAAALSDNAPLIGVPTMVTAPVITGPVSVGSTLSTTNGTWTGNPTFTYQWLRCNGNGASCADIPGAHDQTYLTTDDDIGHRVRVKVTATNSAGGATVLAATVLSDNAPLIGVPTLVTAPVVSGATTVGSLLSTSDGTWTGSPTLSYQWLRCNASAPATCSDIASETGNTYTISTDDIGFRIRVRVTAVNVTNAAVVTLSSNATKVVTAS